MEQIKKDILQLVQKNKPITVTKLMIEYFQLTGKHLYLEVNELGHNSVPDFLADFDELFWEISTENTLDFQVQLNRGKSECSPVKMVSPIDKVISL